MLGVIIKNINIGKLILGSFIILILFVSLLEIILRIRGVQFYPGNKPNIVVTPGGNYFQKDSLLGFKHKAGKFIILLNNYHEFTTQHDSLTLRITSPMVQSEAKITPEIWIFGCSFTHGWSINDDETFPWILQSKLSEFKIINWGVSGYGTIHFYLQLREAFKKRNKPHLVIINHADFHFIRNSFSFMRRRIVSKWNFLGSLNQPYCKLDDDGEMDIMHSDVAYNPWELSKYSAFAYYCEIKYESYLDSRNKMEEKEITTILLDRIVSLCIDNQVKIILTNIGPNAEYIQEYSLMRNIPFIDISVNLGEKGFTNKPYDNHPSSKANIIYANKIYAFLREFIITEE